MKVISKYPLLFNTLEVIVVFLVFSLVAMVPGDAAQTLAGGTDARPDDVEMIRTELRLNDPFLVQYGSWLGGVLTFDFGNSLYTGRPISEEIGRRLPATLSLAAATIAIRGPGSRRAQTRSRAHRVRGKGEAPIRQRSVRGCRRGGGGP